MHAASDWCLLSNLTRLVEIRILRFRKSMIQHKARPKEEEEA